jgi:hypothetical protein
MVEFTIDSYFKPKVRAGPDPRWATRGFFASSQPIIDFLRFRQVRLASNCTDQRGGFGGLTKSKMAACNPKSQGRSESRREHEFYRFAP